MMVKNDHFKNFFIKKILSLILQRYFNTRQTVTANSYTNLFGYSLNISFSGFSASFPLSFSRSWTEKRKQRLNIKVLAMELCNFIVPEMLFMHNVINVHIHDVDISLKPGRLCTRIRHLSTFRYNKTCPLTEL